MIVALVVEEDNDLGWYIWQQFEAVPGTNTLIDHTDMWSCFVYVAKDQEDLQQFVDNLNAEWCL